MCNGEEWRGERGRTEEGEHLFLQRGGHARGTQRDAVLRPHHAAAPLRSIHASSTRQREYW